jgi:lipoate-protein ligase B
LILCEHFPVFTLGRLGKVENILADKESLKSKGLEIISVNRGGDITFHGPGQLVAYPIFNLANYKKDLRYFLNKLEEVAIEFLKHFGCFAYAKKGFTGVWLQEKKIASIGIGVKRWVSFHGLAININTDLHFFSVIKPCGLDVEMTSLSQAVNRKINMDTAKKVIAERFKALFGFNLNPPY